MADSLAMSVFSAFAGGELDFQWGIGREVLLTDVVPGVGREQEECAFGTARWQVVVLAVCCLLLVQLAVDELTALYRDEPSSAQRQVAYDTMKLYRALHTQALQGKSAPEVVAPALPQYASCSKHIHFATDQDKATRLQSILEYSQEVTSVLQAACRR